MRSGQLWRLGLHAEGEFVRLDHAFELCVHGRLTQMFAVHLLEQVELFALLVDGEFGVLDVADLRLVQGNVVAADRCALVDRG